MKLLILFCTSLFLLESCSKTTIPVPDPPAPTDTLSAGWSKIIVPDASFSDILFIDSNTGYVVGDKGLFKSVDGGHTWQLTSTRFAGDGYLAATANGSVFVIISHADTVYSSFDGGFNFSAIKLNAPVPLTDIYFTGNDTGYVPAGSNILYRTTDGGHNWQTVAPISGLSLVQGNLIPFFINGNTGWISDGYTVFHSLGTVNSWSSSSGLPRQPAGDGYMPLAVIDANVVYTSISTKSTTAVYKSTDGGATFLLAGQVASSDASYADIHFIDANTGYVCNSKSIFATTDGGSSWTKVVSLPNDFIAEIHFTDRDHGWACGRNGIVLIFKR